MAGWAHATRSARETDAAGVTVRHQRVRHEHTGARLVVFGVLAVLILLVAVLCERIAPYDPYAQDLTQTLQPPSAAHPASTDRFGRDILSRVICGANPSVFSTLVLVATVSVVGTVVGVACGWLRGRLATVLMRVSDLFLAFPGPVFALAIAGMLGGGMMNAALAIAVIGWPKYARMAHGLTLAHREEPYLDAARLAGCSTASIVFHHLLPNIAGPLLVTAMLDIGTMMMELAGLSFLGLGAQPPVAEWGSMMSDGRGLMQLAPWTVIAPGVAIFITAMVFNLLGDTVRDYLDPTYRTRRQATRGAKGMARKREAKIVDGTRGRPEA